MPAHSCRDFPFEVGGKVRVGVEGKIRTKREVIFHTNATQFGVMAARNERQMGSERELHEHCVVPLDVDMNDTCHYCH